MIRVRSFSTVRTLRFNRSAISLDNIPPATIRAISLSRAVNTLGGGPSAPPPKGDAEYTDGAGLTSAEKYMPPANTRRTARSMCSNVDDLSTNPATPNAINSPGNTGVELLVITTNRTDSSRSRKRRISSRPSRSGRRKSVIKI